MSLRFCRFDIDLITFGFEQRATKRNSKVHTDSRGVRIAYAKCVVEISAQNFIFMIATFLHVYRLKKWNEKNYQMFHN